ncbi:MAG: hypothetical protein IIY55_08515 [Blautia sp.]|nr:hypothetical protein [Blautia sp.]
MRGRRKCQICDGPIVNGRCKYCGMPYRSDEELYHLNENRREHYRHVSSSVRQKLRESEIPLSDRNSNAYIEQIKTGNRKPQQKRQGKKSTNILSKAGIAYVIFLLFVVLVNMGGCR